MITTYFCIRLYNSKYGRAMRSIRKDEVSTTMMGINTTYYKVLVFVLSAIVCAVSGAIYVPQLGYIDQDTFTFDISTLILSIVILSGMKTIRGMYVGAMAVAKELSDTDSISVKELYEAYEVMDEDMKERGKVEEGWKTMVDTISPAVKAFEDGFNNDLEEKEILEM